MKEIKIAQKAQEHIVERHFLKKSGDAVKDFTAANTALGILIMRFDNM